VAFPVAGGNDRRVVRRAILTAFHPAEAQVTPRRLLAHVINGLAALLVALALFVTHANVGLISRPSSEDFSFGG
jgi:hypothetical protein